jgi:hypothetical protein
MKPLTEFLNEDRLDDIKRNNQLEGIFYANEKKKKIKTTLGDKTLKEFKEMVLSDKYTSKELATAIFAPNSMKEKSKDLIKTDDVGGVLGLGGLELRLDDIREN